MPDEWPAGAVPDEYGAVPDDCGEGSVDELLE